ARQPTGADVARPRLSPGNTPRLAAAPARRLCGVGWPGRHGAEPVACRTTGRRTHRVRPLRPGTQAGFPRSVAGPAPSRLVLLAGLVRLDRVAACPPPPTPQRAL